jgi:hypothetical protein
MTLEQPLPEDDVTQLARRVEKARGRLAFQFDPALTEALSEGELHAERELAEKIREQERDQRWKHVQAMSSASDRARQTSQEIAKADMRDLLMARKAIAAQRRESSPHAKLASLYQHRAWSLRALAGVVAAGMLWSAVNVQHNLAPGGPSDPLYWFSYLLEAMISVCLVIIMIGTNKVAEWGILDNRWQVALAEISLLSLTVGLNTYPYLRAGDLYDVGVHAVAPVMIGVSLLIHHAASSRYGLAIAQATEHVRDMPDPAEQIRRTMPTFVSFFRQGTPSDVKGTPSDMMRPVPALTSGTDTPAPAEPGRKAHDIDAVVTDGAGARTVEVDDVDAPIPPVSSMDGDAGADLWLGKSTIKSDSGKDDGNGKKGKDMSSGSTEDTDTFGIYDTGSFRIAESLEQELAELRAERRRARAAKQRAATNGASID